MAKEDDSAIDVVGTVIKVLPATMYKVQLENLVLTRSVTKGNMQNRQGMGFSQYAKIPLIITLLIHYHHSALLLIPLVSVT